MEIEGFRGNGWKQKMMELVEFLENGWKNDGNGRIWLGKMMELEGFTIEHDAFCGDLPFQNADQLKLQCAFAPAGTNTRSFPSMLGWTSR